ncbi:MerR family transcriptional regulator [Nocardia rhamnosiphila]|uniref:MerR family transcriptional regulator n=1 Tax=Nocardia rhamnosiphila TaxID=426716 RepID=UPI000A671F5F|nr:MerR family transcriptional regulator [Nocardia rhamnosiphila]
MRIGELAAATGTSQRLLRYYEERGLLRPERDANGYRSYPDTAVGDVARIRRLLAAGLPIRVITEVLDCAYDGTDYIEPCGADPAHRTVRTRRQARRPPAPPDRTARPHRPRRPALSTESVGIGGIHQVLEGA